MNCPNCGAFNQDGMSTCASCGAALTQQPQQPIYGYQPQQPGYGYQPYAPVPAQQPGKGLAIAALVCGILSFLLFPIVFGPLGIILGGVAKSQGCKSPMATAGIVCGVIGLVAWIIMLIVGAAAFASFF